MKRHVICMLTAFTTMTAWAGEAIDQSIEAEEGVILSVENVHGLVQVNGWDRPEVKVTGELGDGAERVVVSGEYGRVVVRVLMPRSGSSSETELIVNAPASSPLRVETVSASIEVSGMKSSQRLSTVSGEVTTASAGEELEVKSATGDIKVTGDGVTTESTVNSVSGDVSIQGVTGEVTGKSVSGDVLLEGHGFESIRLSSTSGDLRVAAGVAGEPKLVLESISGDTIIDVDGDISGEFELRTRSGEIDNCFGPEPVTDEIRAGQSLSFSDGEGKADVRATTMSGDIRLCRGS